jgi:hypothetical protein
MPPKKMRSESPKPKYKSAKPKKAASAAQIKARADFTAMVKAKAGKK